MKPNVQQSLRACTNLMGGMTRQIFDFIEQQETMLLMPVLSNLYLISHKYHFSLAYIPYLNFYMPTIVSYRKSHSPAHLFVKVLIL